jgi:hypothetical protein
MILFKQAPLVLQPLTDRKTPETLRGWCLWDMSRPDNPRYSLVFDGDPFDGWTSSEPPGAFEHSSIDEPQLAR